MRLRLLATTLLILNACLRPSLTAPNDTDGTGDTTGPTGPTDMTTTDTTAPAAITTLTATTTGLHSVRLDWTSVGDDDSTGTATSYEIRQASAAITNVAEFEAAFPIMATIPAPAVAGTMQSVTATGLAPDAMYFFAIRAVDDATNKGGVSNSPSAVPTTARATFQISEIAPVNTATENFDFVELVALTAGRADGVGIVQSTETLYTLDLIEVVAGDRVVVHISGSLPTGGAQEDASGDITASSAAAASATAWDVYSGAAGIVATDNIITVEGDDGSIQDAVVISNRDGDATIMTELAALGAQWPFAPTPADGVNDCATQTQAVTVATGNTSCGGFPIAVAGNSLQRAAGADNNAKRDFYWAAQTPGLANAVNPPPTVVSATATSATEVRVRFDDEVTNVALAGFSIPTLTVSAASLVDVHIVALTTSAQTPGTPYTVTATSATDLQGLTVGTPSSANFNGFTPPDAVAPSGITDLAVAGTGASTARLTWTSVGDDGNVGTASVYDVRFSTAPITDLTTFGSANQATGEPTPQVAGSSESFTVTGLNPTTTYFFAVRAGDDGGNFGALSNTPVSASTVARASLRITEAAVDNSTAQGFDFVELVVTATGRTDGLTISQAAGTLYTLAGLDLVTGDRIVVHTTGTSGFTGAMAQEDVDIGGITASNAPFASATAWDVYSPISSLAATDNVFAVRAGSTIQDALAISNRDGTISASTLSDLAALHPGSWTFPTAPTGGNNCETQRACVSNASSDTACGGFDVVAGAGRSFNRNGLTDTNTKADFYVAAQTPGAANNAPTAPSFVSVSTTNDTTVVLRFDQEIDPTTVTTGNFSFVSGLTTNTASLSDVHVVSLQTTQQVASTNYVVQIGAVENLQDIPLTPVNAGFCAFGSPTAQAILNEVAPTQSGGQDLVELRVTQAGSLGSLTLHQNPTASTSGTLLATLPPVCAAIDDLVIVHMSPDPTPANESMSKNQFANASFSQNYDNAWDVRGTGSNVTFSDAVLTLLDPSGTMIDAAAFSNWDGATTSGFDVALAQIQLAGQWSVIPGCGPSACTGPSAQSGSVLWAGSTAVTGAVGQTVGRNSAGTDTNAATDFSGPAAHSMGAANP